MKDYLELLKVDEYKIEVPKLCGYNWTIGIVAFVFVAACGFCYWACRTEYFSWESIVFSSVVIIVFGQKGKTCRLQGAGEKTNGGIWKTAGCMAGRKSTKSIAGK